MTYRALAAVTSKPLLRRHNTIPCINPSNEQVICNVAAAGAEDVNMAVLAARKAFDSKEYLLDNRLLFADSTSSSRSWPKLSGTERASYLRAISEKIIQRKEILSNLGIHVLIF